MDPDKLARIREIARAARDPLGGRGRHTAQRGGGPLDHLPDPESAGQPGMTLIHAEEFPRHGVDAVIDRAR
jgi:hypothetical protein